MARSFAAALVTAVAFFVACGGDDPGGPTSVEIEGQVISSRSGAPVSDAAVSIGNVLGDDFVETTTDSEGRFTATVEYFVCEGVSILVDHPDYLQGPPPNVCPETPRTVELEPNPVSTLINPQDPTVAAGGTVAFSARVTFADGTVEETGSALWFVAAEFQDVVCGTFSEETFVQGVTYTAPPVPPPAECGASAGQAAVVAAPESRIGGILEASDTIVVTVTP